MKWHWLVAAAAFATVPDTASAQVLYGADNGWGPKFRATPFVGWSPGFESAGSMAIFTGGANPTLESAVYVFDYAPGPMTGLNLEYRVHGRFSAVGTATWSSRGKITAEDEDGFLFEQAGSDFYIGKVGVLMRFREDSELQLRRLNAAVFLGPAFIREKPETTRFSPPDAFTASRNHWGVNWGAEAELPFDDKRFAFHAAIEDFVIFWNETALQDRFDADVRNTFGDEAALEVDADHSNLFAIRIGLSFRFR